MKTKLELRRYVAKLKKQTPLAERKLLSERIMEKLEHNDAFIRAGVVLMYYSLPDEVYTHSFIDKWRKEKTILLPVVKNKTEMDIREYTGRDDLKEGAFHIWEPSGVLFTDYNAIETAVVPGIAFDESGNRLGRGGGYYDRLLPQMRAYKLGICFPFQLLDRLPHEEYDVMMDEVITMKR